MSAVIDGGFEDKYQAWLDEHHGGHDPAIVHEMLTEEEIRRLRFLVWRKEGHCTDPEDEDVHQAD